ncbi:uncharacterized protein LOC105355020 isoform X5 [Oryzias latipes]
MSISLCCCLIVFALTSHVAADFVHIAVNETRPITLHCNPPINGLVKWNRETNGTYSNIITADGDGDMKHTNDARYNSQADKSLVITNVKFSDSGKYYCNNDAAVELTVIPSGTTIKSVKETETVTLKCPDEDEGSDDSKWSRQFGEIPQQRFQMKKKKLIIKDVKQEDTGLYYCGGKPAVFLNVTSRPATKKPFRTMPTSITTTSTKTTTTPTTISTIPTATRSSIPKGSWRSTNPIPKTTESATPLNTATSPNIYMFLSMWIKATITVLVTIIIILLIITNSPTWRLRREADKKTSRLRHQLENDNLEMQVYEV